MKRTTGFAAIHPNGTIHQWSGVKPTAKQMRRDISDGFRSSDEPESIGWIRAKYKGWRVKRVIVTAK